MPKQKQSIQNLPLFGDVADAEYLRGFKTKDDRKFDREAKRKSRGKKHAALERAPRTGPACIRCVDWMPPRADEEYGECSHLVRIEEDVKWANATKGQITDRDTARLDWSVAYERLKTGEAFRCSDFKSIDGIEYVPETIKRSPLGTLAMRAQAKGKAA